MKLFDIVRDANQNLLRNKLRSTLTVLAIFVGSFAIISTSAIRAGINNFIDSQTTNNGGKGYLSIVSKDSMEALQVLQNNISGTTPIEYNPEKVQTGMSPISDEQIAKLKQIEGIDPDSISSQNSLSVTYVTSTNNHKKYLISATAMPPGDFNIDLEAGNQLERDVDEYQIILEHGYVEAFGYTSDTFVGQTIQLAVLDEFTHLEKIFDAKVVGIAAPGIVSTSSYVNKALSSAIYNENTKYYPEESKNRSYALEASYDYKNYSAEHIKSQLENIGLYGNTYEDLIGSLKTFFDVILTVFKIFGFIALIAAAIGIINTLFMSVQERTREIGLDKALGMSSFHVFLSFSLEAVALGFWGSVVGIILSMLIGNAVNAAFHTEGALLASFPTFDIVSYTIGDVLSVLLLIVIVAFLAGTLPARQAARKNPIDALRYE